MSQYPGGERDRYQRFYEQLAEIEGRLGTKLVVEPPAAGPGTGVPPRYLYEDCQLQCSGERAERFAQQLLANRCSQRDPEPGEHFRRLPVDPDVHIPTEVDRLNAEIQDSQPDRAGAPAYSPHHLVSIATLNPVTICPADEPKPVPAGTKVWPPKADHGGAGVRVLIVDTGLPDGHPWQELEESKVLRVGGGWQTVLGEDQLIQQYAGHGTFVTGVFRAAAPDAQVAISNALELGGARLEGPLGDAILDALEEMNTRDGWGWPHIISLSAGGTSHRNRNLLGLQPLQQWLAEHPETLLVAAAGNDGNRDNLFFPAAHAAVHPGIVSVGALRRSPRGRTCFSNYGSTVTLHAPGEHHVNHFVSGFYAYRHPREAACRYHQPPLYPDCTCLGDPDYGSVVHFSGMARWSGTSYATPLVAGMIARHMSEVGTENARRAAQDLFATRRETIADLDGELLPVLRLGSDQLA